MVKRHFFGKDYGQDERDYCSRPRGLAEIARVPRLGRRDFLQREALVRLGTNVYRKVRESDLIG